MKFTLENQTMMHHPMHLHGHFFRVLNGQGDRSPLKHTVDVPPHETREIEFLADEPGEWMLHCHNLYHMHSGMARVVKYENYTPSPAVAHLQHHDPHLHEHLYGTGKFELSPEFGTFTGRLARFRDELELRAEASRDPDHDKTREREIDLYYKYYLDQYLHLAAGLSDFHDEQRGEVGAGLLLPLLI